MAGNQKSTKLYLSPSGLSEIRLTLFNNGGKKSKFL